MTKVWIVEGDWIADGSYIRGVYASREAALLANPTHHVVGSYMKMKAHEWRPYEHDSESWVGEAGWESMKASPWEVAE